MRFRSTVLVTAAVTVLVAGCSASDEPTVAPLASPPSALVATTVTPATTPPTVTTSVGATTTIATTTIATTIATTTTTIATTTTVPPTTTLPATTTTSTTPAVPTVPDASAIDALAFPTDTEIEIGRSVEGRPITAIRRGDPTGTRVLAVGVVHGNEADGRAIVEQLAVAPVPDGVELWLVPTMNPDGEAIGDRQNANAVDLNRNFPENWDVLGEPGFWQYGGASPASEPETRAIVALGDAVRPEIVLWYHQDLFRLAPDTGRAGELRALYATITGLPIVDISGGTYTGTAAQWARTVIVEPGTSITVELGPTVSAGEIEAHVAAVHAIAGF